MLIAKLTISYDRGLARNVEKDLGIEKFNRETDDGKMIAGLGMHYRSRDAKDFVKIKDKEASRIRQAFREKFLVTLFEGCYFVQVKDLAEKFLTSLDVVGIECRVDEYDLTSESALGVVELREWADKVKRQLSDVQLGRKKEADTDGLDSLSFISNCPLLSRDTASKIKELVEDVRMEKITKLDLKRSISGMKIEIEESIISPKRGKL